jgi:hypothetical protein
LLAHVQQHKVVFHETDSVVSNRLKNSRKWRNRADRPNADEPFIAPGSDLVGQIQNLRHDDNDEHDETTIASIAVKNRVHASYLLSDTRKTVTVSGAPFALSGVIGGPDSL